MDEIDLQKAAALQSEVGHKGLRKCPECGQWKPWTEATGDGTCKQCQQKLKFAEAVAKEPKRTDEELEELHQLGKRIRELSNRMEVALAEGDNPVSAKCALVLDSPIKCYDFSGSRRFAACRAWQLMEEMKISWQEAITKAWEEIKSRCTWD